MNITLIGMPGSGKSFVGKALADQLGYQVVDFDREMERMYGGVPLQKLVDEWGDKLFILREGDFAIEMTRDQDNLIISPGGSIVYSAQAMDHLREVSSIAYLRAPLSVIEERIGAAPPRGIIGLKGKTLAELYDERTPLYERYAHAAFDVDADAEDVAKKIIEELF